MDKPNLLILSLIITGGTNGADNDSLSVVTVIVKFPDQFWWLYAEIDYKYELS